MPNKFSCKNVIFPLVLGDLHGSELEYQACIGTAFRIGHGHFGLTARHVVEGQAQVFAMLQDESDQYVPIMVECKEFHPTEDIAILKFAAFSSWPTTTFSMYSEPVLAGIDYQLIGYPKDSATNKSSGNRHVLLPETCYNRGYVRRRVTENFPQIKGTDFIEVSEVAGIGASGSPLFLVGVQSPTVIGVYCTERRRVGACEETPPPHVGYAVRTDGFADWAPRIVGRSIREESLS